MKIGNALIGPGLPPYVIAEIGSNHDGSIEQARRLIQAAADAGADCAKFQLYRGDKLYPGSITPGAIPDWWLPVLKGACREEGIEFMCSVFCLETLAVYVEVGPVAVKVASPEATDMRLLDAVAGLALTAIVSTGAMEMSGVDGVVERFRDNLVLLHCVSAYPAELGHLNLGVVGEMRKRYGVPVGLSDHTLEPCLAPVVAVALGACVVEKHLTLDRSLVGADHGFALEPGEFGLMVDAVRSVPLVLGDGVKRVQPSEDATDRRAA